MNIETIIEMESCFLVNGNISVPKDQANSDYQKIQEWIDEGNAPEPDPALSLENRKIKKLQELKNKKKIMLEQGFTVDGVLFDSDINARIAYHDFESLLRVQDTFKIDWKASNTEWVVMDKVLFEKIKVTLTEHMQNIFAWCKTKQEEISSAPTVSALTLIKLDSI